MADNRRQLGVFAVLVGVNASLAFLVFVLGLHHEFLNGRRLPEPLDTMPPWVLGLANAGIITVVYGLLGLAGLWFARRLELPGIYRERAGWHALLVVPMLLGAGLGVLLVIGDRLFALAGPPGWSGFPHPTFPMSLIASATAGIGEEVVFRLFVMGLWAFLLNLLLRRSGRTRTALWIANAIAALAFGAGHLPGVVMILGVAGPADIHPAILTELFVLNGVVGLVAGARCMKDGLVAAVGVHFWTDIVWHVVWPALGRL